MSFFLMTVQQAFRVMGRNRLRSGLTMLGIIIGVGAVVAMVSLGQGASASVQAQIASIGTNVLIVIPGATTVSGIRGGLGGMSTLTVEDAKDLAQKVTGVASMSYAIRDVLQVVHENKNWRTPVIGTTVAYPIIREWATVEGTFFAQSDEDQAAKVAVLGKTAADNLFERGEEIVGAQIRIKNVPLRVLGVLAPKGQSFMGQDQDDFIAVPFPTAEHRVLGTKFLGTVGIIFLSTERADQLAGAVEEIRDLLRARHRLQPNEDDDFTIRTMDDIAKASAGASRTMMLMLLGIASISLVVGGIGVMNILLVSVTERTHEIGLRMAVGAKRWHILLQFLVEAVILSTIGGIAGVAAGVAGARLATTLAGWPTIISPPAVVIAFLFSFLVGVFFGLYPANKASRLNPIEALRYE
ncbi:MAG: ABC transporter permease [Nitrospirae bacterium]|nr:ABC transporter permease [Nitrospirota bacterium]